MGNHITLGIALADGDRPGNDAVDAMTGFAYRENTFTCPIVPAFPVVGKQPGLPPHSVHATQLHWRS